MSVLAGFMSMSSHRYLDHGWFLAGIPLTILAVSIIPYFIPSIIAFLRKHENAVPLFLVNIFLGWTLIGWIICLVWALTGSGAGRTVAPAPPKPEAKAAEPVPTPDPDRKHCSQCGIQIEPSDAFCRRCGTKLSS
jgi:hypothetical protein